MHRRDKQPQIHSSDNIDHLSRLNDDCLEQVCSSLDPADLVKLMVLSQRFDKVAKTAISSKTILIGIGSGIGGANIYQYGEGYIRLFGHFIRKLHIDVFDEKKLSGWMILLANECPNLESLKLVVCTELKARHIGSLSKFLDSCSSLKEITLEQFCSDRVVGLLTHLSPGIEIVRILGATDREDIQLMRGERKRIPGEVDPQEIRLMLQRSEQLIELELVIKSRITIGHIVKLQPNLKKLKLQIFNDFAELLKLKKLVKLEAIDIAFESRQPEGTLIESLFLTTIFAR